MSDTTSDEFPGGVQRARLVDEVLAAAPGAPCLISAPLGYGRTTLLRQAAATVDERSVLHLHVSTAEAVPRDDLLAELRAARSAGDVRWVFIDDDSRSGDLAGDHWVDVVDDVCGWAGLVISSDASLDGIALRFPHSAILDRRDLAFTDDEAAAVLQLLSPGVAPTDAAAVIDLSEGWVAPLVLAAARLRRGHHESVASWLHAVGAETVVDPWWRTLTPAHQLFLHETSVLDDLDPAACDAVREADDSKSLLRDITRREGLVVRDVSAGAQPTWRRHRLLTEALIATGGGTDETVRHERAAAFYLSRGGNRTAIQHLIEAEQYREAGTLLREFENALFASDQADVALNWYEKLSPADWDSGAEHELRVGWASLWTGDITTARQCLARLQAWLASPSAASADTGDSTLLRGEVHLLEAYLAGSMADTARMTRLAREAVAAFVGHGEANSHQLAPVLVARGLLWEGRVEDAVEALGRICVVDMSSDFVREFSARGVQAGCAAAQGHMHEAAAIVAAVAGYIGDHGGDDAVVGHTTLAVAQASVWLESGDHPRAQAYLEAVEAAAARRSSVGALTYARLQRCHAAIRARDTVEALDIVQLARGELRAVNPNSGMWPEVDRVHARVLLAAGDIAGAEALIRHLPPSQHKTLLAAWSLVGQRPTQVIRALTELRPHSPRAAVERRFLLAQASLTANPAMVGPHLRRGAEIAQRHGLAGLIVEHPRLWPLVQADHSSHSRVLAARLSTAGQSAGSGGVKSREAVAPGPALPRLSPGEETLLARLPSRATQNQLAEEFGVSPNTIKTRLRRLYRKLDVSGRDEAIAAARMHRLLPPDE